MILLKPHHSESINKAVAVLLMCVALVALAIAWETLAPPSSLGTQYTQRGLDAAYGYDSGSVLGASIGAGVSPDKRKDGHFACGEDGQSKSCSFINKPGLDTCRGDPDCQKNQHFFKCDGEECKRQNGIGDNGCNLNGPIPNEACTGTHLECVNDKCTQVTGGLGKNQCSPASVSPKRIDTCTSQVHFACQGQSCAVLPGSGGGIPCNPKNKYDCKYFPRCYGPFWKQKCILVQGEPQNCHAVGKDCPN